MSDDAGDLGARIALALAPFETVRVAYLFGSRSRRDARPDSDLDIAVAFPREASDREREVIRRAMIAALTDALGHLGERADIVDLDSADSAVAFRAIRDGKLVITRDDRDRVRVVTRVARRYEDDAPKRALFRRAALGAVARMRGR